MAYQLILKSLKTETEIIVLEDTIASREYAEQSRKQWRRVLGNKNWTVDRRPGLDTLDHLALCIREIRK